MSSSDLNDFLASVGPIRTGTPVVEAKQDDRPKFSCVECAGTGIWKGVRVHQQKRECFACKGKGYFLKSPHDRQKARQKSAERKAKRLDEIKTAYNEANPGVIEGLQAISSWHSFAGNLLQGFEKYGALTENQTAAARKTIIKVAEKQAEREAAKASKTGDVDVSKIVAAFDTAKAAGLKRLGFRTERIAISLASEFSKNAGALYVKCDGEYAGKIVSGKFLPINSAPADILDLIRAIAASPLEAAKQYGIKTGICSCCGRELTDPKSIALGIGPICIDKWGF